jgi:hypothetical protein
MSISLSEVSANVKELGVGFLTQLPVFGVDIHQNEDNVGFWAKCKLECGVAYTDGDSIVEVQRNMYESVSLCLKDDYPDITGFLLEFRVCNE